MKSLSVHHFRGSVRWTVMAAWAVALVWAVALPAQTAHSQSAQTPWPNLTPSQLTAVWWQWVLGVPSATNPLLDVSGTNAASNQPYYTAQGNPGLFFLSGTFTVTTLENGDVLGQVERSISVKQGTAFFFPILNGEWDNICYKPHLGGNCAYLQQFPQVLGVPQLQALVAAQENGVSGLYATLTPLNGPTQNLSYQRLQSPPFSYTLPSFTQPSTDNLYHFLYGIDVQGTVAPVVSDGYWSFISGTLAAGDYVLRFGGTAANGTSKFIEAITYHITITP